MVEYDLGLVVGSDGAKGDKGDKGDKGAKGDAGKGITSIQKTSSSGKVDTYTITYSDGSTSTFTVTNGSDASVTVDSSLSSTSTNPVQNKIINSALNGKASSSHSHSISDVSNLQSSLDGKSDTGHTHTKSNITDFAHTHDDRYYTETETDNLLSGKASSSHSHSKSDITDFPSIPSASSTTPSADTTNGSVGTGSTYARSNHTHPKSSLYAEASHTHTISNVTDLQTTLDGKASSSHSHTKSDISDFPSIPSKISDLTNDSDFIEKSSTAGLVKNDGTIDTTAYLSKMKVGSSANYLVYTTSGGVLASKQKLGNINYLGRIGSTSGLPLKTGSNGVIETGSFGTSSGTFAEGNHTHSEYVNPVIVDNLTTSDATKVLSAKQGYQLNQLIGQAISYINQ